MPCDGVGVWCKKGQETGIRRKLLGVIHVFINSITVMVSLGYTSVKTDQIIFFKHVLFTVCQLYLKKAIK